MLEVTEKPLVRIVCNQCNVCNRFRTHILIDTLRYISLLYCIYVTKYGYIKERGLHPLHTKGLRCNRSGYKWLHWLHPLFYKGFLKSLFVRETSKPA